MSVERFLPSDIEPSQVVARLGLVSDTHMPERCEALPASLFQVMAGVDLLLHAGDIGELWVLERLSAIAPVIAVHGNDTTPEAQRALPYSQVIAVGGKRIFLWHSHYPDWSVEMDSRRFDDLRPKLARTAEVARNHGASIAVFGHWHMPLVYENDGVLVINPGAIASGNEISRQLHQTAALLFLLENGDTHVIHVDLAVPDRAFDPAINFDAGFRANFSRFSTTILDPELAAVIPVLRAKLPPDEVESLRQLVLGLARRCWDGEFDALTMSLIIDEAEDSGLLTADAKAFILNVSG